MALSVILTLYVAIGLMAATGSVVIVKKLFSGTSEQTCFALFLIPIAGFYLAFTAHFGDPGAWPLETVGVLVFAVMGVLGVRVPVVLIVGYLVHGLWDAAHELHAHGGFDLFGAPQVTEIPLAYGAFCAAFDWYIAAYFYMRLRE